MELFSRLWNASSQKDPPVKPEPHSDSVGPLNESNVNGMEEAEKNGDVETQSQDGGERTRDGEERAMIVTNPTRRKNKRKSKKATKEVEVDFEAEMQQVEDENSLEANAGLQLLAEATIHGQDTRGEGSIMELESVANKEAEHVTKDQSNPDLSELPRRIKKAKKEKKRRSTNQLSTEPLGDSNESAARSHQLLTTADATRKPTDNTLESSLPKLPRQGDYQSDIALAVANGVEEAAPKQPSKKALGKRKVTEEAVVQGTNKRAKHGNDKRPRSQDLTTMGFIPTPSNELRSSQVQREASVTSDHLSNSLGALVRTLFRQTQDSSPEPATASVTVNASSKKSSKKSKLPITTQTPKPFWNAINKPAELAEGSNQSLLASHEEAEKSTVPEPVAPKSSQGRKRRLPVDGPSCLSLTPAENLQSKSKTPTPKTPKPKTPKPKTPKSKAPKSNEPRSADPNTPAGKQMKKRPATGGVMSKEQKAAIYSAANSYKELTNLTDQQLIDIIQGDALLKAAKELWTEVCGEVPDIPRRSVQQTCRRKFHSFEGRGVWTADQDEDLRIAYEEHPDKWKLIGETLNRFPEDARDRWRNYLVCGDMQKLNQNWELEEENKLRAAVKQCVDEIRQWRGLDETDAPDESLIEWQKVSKLMGQTRSRIQCRYKWNKLKDRGQVDDDDPVSRMPVGESWRLENAALQARLFSPAEKLQLLRAIRDSKASREGKIPWRIIKDDLDGKGKRMAWKYCFRMLRAGVPGYESMDFQQVVLYLVNVFEKSEPSEPDGFDIPVESFQSSHQTNAKNSAKKNKKKAKAHGKATSSGDNGSDQYRRSGNGEGASTRPKKNIRSSAQAGSDAEAVDKRPIVKKKKKRSIRDRMLKEGESQETTTTHSESAAFNVSEDVIQSFQALRHTPKKRAKRPIRVSKRNQALSEEKVVESQSSQEEVFINDHASQTEGDGMDVDHAETYTTAAGPDVDEENNNEEPNTQREDSDEDRMITTHGFPGEEDNDSDDLDPDRTLITNGFHDRESPDLDMPTQAEGKLSGRLSLSIDGYGDAGSDDSSDDNDMSDIPARRQAKEMSIEL